MGLNQNKVDAECWTVRQGLASQALPLIVDCPQFTYVAKSGCLCVDDSLQVLNPSTIQRALSLELNL